MRMARYIFRFCLYCLLLVPVFIQAQTAKVTLDCENKPLSYVFRQIEAQTDYLFIYNKEKVDIERNVTAVYNNTPVFHILDNLLADASLCFVMEGSYIILQSRTISVSGDYITGRVTDEVGLPIVGALIIDMKGKQCTLTDASGHFSIMGSDTMTLEISYLGYLPVKKSVYAGQIYNIVLQEKTWQLDEVVVIGYGSIKRKEVTSAISHLSSKDILNIHAGNPLETIQGKVAGMNISNQAPADPNSLISVQIRGASSRYAGLGPLIVIDGVPGGNLYNVNENDIESIDILKDGAASAIYGTRGSNGVVLVTTKKGATTGLVNTNYNGYLALNIINDKPEVLSRDEFLKYKRGDDYGYVTDWFKELTRPAVVHSYTISLSGGNIRNNYRATVDYRHADGIDLRSDREEVGGRFSMNHRGKTDLYKFVLNVAPRTIKMNHADYAVYQSALSLNPTQPVKNPEDSTGKTYFKTVGFGSVNPVEALKLDLNGQEVKYLDWDITGILDFSALFDREGKHNLNTQITVAQQINDSFTYYFRPSYNTELSESENKKGFARRQYSKNIQQSLEWLANYTFEANGHSARVMGGYSYQKFENSGLYAENYNFTSDALTYNNLGDGTWYKNIVTDQAGFNSWKNDSKLIAFFGRASYDYKQRYLFTASLRYEGSSKFGTNHKWGYFPAVSAGWRISEESFMKGIGWINDLKLRGDFGMTGNQDFESYLSIPTMQGYGTVTYRGGQYQGWGPLSNPNPDLRWEKGVNWNIGLDFTAWDHRIGGSLNYYNRKSQDLLGWYDVPAPPNLHPQTFLNVGTMVNNGIEVEMNVEAVRTKDFSYSVGLVASTNGNKLKSFSNDQYEAKEYQRMVRLTSPNIDDDIQELREGQRIGNFYTYAYAGVDENGGWLVWNKDNKEKIPFSQAKDEDKRIVGNGLPRFTASLNNTFRYKNFDVTVYFRGVFGFDIYNIHNCYYGVQGTSDNVLKEAYGKNAHIKAVNIPCDYFIEPGDYIKLDVVTLGYTIKPSFKWIESLRVYATGKNLATITKFSGVDPQSYPINGLTPGATADRGYYPSTTQLLAGVQFHF